MNKKMIVKIFLATVTIVAISVGSFFAGRASYRNAHRLFKINPNEVTSIVVKNGDMLTKMEITDSEQIREIVRTVNKFIYTSAERWPQMDGNGDSIAIQTKSGWVTFGFWDSGARVTDGNGEAGSHILYYGDQGCFDSLVELANNATDPLND